MTGRLAAALFILSLAGSASAQDGWRDAVASDVRNSTDYTDFRVHDPALFLSARGDFDGDGRVDVVRLRVNESARKFAVVVADARGQHVVLEGPLSDLPRYGVSLVRKGRIQSACFGEDACPQQYLDLSTDAFDVAVFESVDTVYYACPAWPATAPTGYCPFGMTD